METMMEESDFVAVPDKDGRCVWISGYTGTCGIPFHGMPFKNASYSCHVLLGNGLEMRPLASFA